MEGAKTLGIIGGGQLGRMLTLAAKSLGLNVVVVDPSDHCPAWQVGAEQIVGNLYDEKPLKELARRADYITIEIEHLDAGVLDTIEKLGTPVNPSPATIRMIQDKYQQKVFLRGQKIATAPFVAVSDLAEAEVALKKFGGKMILKTRHGAYDGRGNAVVKSKFALQAAFARFAGAELYAEALVPFVKELAVMVARDTKGDIALYPVVETIHQRNICIEVIAPAVVDVSAEKAARSLARKVAKHLQGAGVFGVEMFLTDDGKVLVNEIAPRVHNSGHYTTEANRTSQFEQHVRAVCDLPLGSTELVTPAAVMINILGERDGETVVVGLDKALGTPQTSVHIYGKTPTKVDRKMGHITATGQTHAQARSRARQARKHIEV